MRKVDEVLQSRDTYWIDAGNTVREAVRYLCERKTGAVAVKDGDEVVGMFSERDLMHRVINVNRDPDTTLVRDVMSRELIFISGDADVRLAKAKMYQNRVRHLLVVGSGNVFRGLLSMRDLMEADVQEANELIHKMNDEYYESAYQAKWTMVANRVIVQPYVPASS